MMRDYAYVRAAHKQITLSHIGAGNIKNSQGVTTCSQWQKGEKANTDSTIKERRKSTVSKPSLILTNASASMSESTIHTDNSLVISMV